MKPALLVNQLHGFASKALADEPMARHTTWGIGGPADLYVEVGNLPDLQKLVAWATRRAMPVAPIGAGSNLLVSDKGLRGLVVRLRGDFEEMEFIDSADVSVGAGVPLPALSRAAAERGLTGAEPFCGIPGTLGGGLMTNAGTPEGDIGQLVESVSVLDPTGAPRVIPKNDLKFSYRHSNLTDHLVLAARLRLRPGDKNEIAAAIDKQLKRRAERQPLGTKNCGSVFKNPPGDHAARLIESVGLKGFQIGGARVSPKHANFIENTGNATATDVTVLIQTIRDRVQAETGVTLELEVWPVGD